VTTYESVIKFPVDANAGEKVLAITEGLEYAAVLLIDEYGWTPDQVEIALDNAYGAASDEWDRIHERDE
jgi:hypothetical protein